MTAPKLKVLLLTGALIAALTPALVAAQNAAQSKAGAPAAKAAAPAAKATAGPTAPAYYGSFRPVKNIFGQPDVSGAWSNASLTGLARAATFGERNVLNTEEVRTREGQRAEDIAKSNARTDPKLTTQEVNKTCDVRGFSGVGCGYNGGFVDPGTYVMRVHGEPRASFITYPANGQVPAPRAASTTIASLGAEEGEESLTRGGRGGAVAGRGGAAAGATPATGRGGGAQRDGTQPENHPAAERCIMFASGRGTLMLPTLYNNNIRIVQGKDSVAIWVEMVHDVRIVRLNGKHMTNGVREHMGDAIGHYEGNTLVVETKNFSALDQIQNRSAADLTLTERFTKVSPTRLLYQFNVHSPANWDQDWGGEYEWQASDGVFEYACHEGNYAFDGILAGELVAIGQQPRAPVTPR